MPSALISNSRPLQERGSTSRMWSERPKRRRALLSIWRAIISTSKSPSASARGSVTVGVLRILVKSDISKSPSVHQLFTNAVNRILQGFRSIDNVIFLNSLQLPQSELRIFDRHLKQYALEWINHTA